MTKNLRLVGLLSYVIITSLAVLIFKPVYIVALLTIFYVPAIINLFWLKNNRGKILVFSLLALVFFAPPVEFCARAANAWQVQTVFPQIFGLIPIENLLFAFVNFFWVLSFYEYFIAEDAPFKISKRFIRLLVLYWLMDIAVVIWFFMTPNFYGLDYHLLALPILIIPFIFLFYRRKKLLIATAKTTLFFFVVLLAYESIAVLIGHWWWPGHYLLPINYFGHIFPLDDIIIWYLFSTPVLIGGYEYFYKGHNK